MQMNITRFTQFKTLKIGFSKLTMLNYSVMRSDRNSSKTDTYQENTTNEQHVSTRIRTSRSYQYYDEIITLEVLAPRKVSIFKLFPSDCITMYIIVYFLYI